MDLIYRISSLSDKYFLDHGCGNGRISIEIARRGVQVGLNDISLTAINKSIKLFKLKNLEHMIVYYYRGHIYNWKGPKSWGSFCSHRVLHTIPAEQRIKSIKFLSNGLNNNGEAIVSAKSVNCNRYKLLLESEDFINISERTFIRLEPFRYIHYFTYEELKNLLEDVGLKILNYFEFREKTGNTLRSKETSQNLYWLFHCKK